MKGKIFKLGIIIMILVLGFLFIGCDEPDRGSGGGGGGGSGNRDSRLFGTWMDSYDGETFIFYSDGTLSYREEYDYGYVSGTWSTSNNNYLTMYNYLGNSTGSNYTISGNRLNLFGYWYTKQ